MESEDKQPGGESPPEAGEASQPGSETGGYGDPASYEAEPYPNEIAAAEASPAPAMVVAGKSSPPPPSPAPAEAEEDEDEEEGMLRMSFLEHLEELRSRIMYALAGIAVSFVLCLVFANQIWQIISQPAIEALQTTGASPNLVFIKPTEAFSIIWVKAPMLVALFLAAPWVLYQVWAFIAPGLYKKERRWAAPFVISTAGLFILGGLFAYFVAFRFGLAFLLSIGRDIHVMPMITATEYFDLFVNATLGIGIVFELPVLLFLLTLLRVVSPRFLLRNTRYAILIIVIIAAVVTPTPDIFNLMLFAVPMCGLFFVGVFASYLLVLHREKRRFPWGKVLYGLLVALVAIGGALYLAVTKYGYHVVPHWPFLTR
ncbi:MAG: twin-arginine translocase subunit TatC [Bryobacteraceae bacterium]